MPSTKKNRAKRRSGWVVVGFIFGALVLGGVLARWSPVAIALAFLLVAGVAVFVMIARPLPIVGLRSRRSGFAALGLSVLLVVGGGMASAITSSTETPTAAVHLIEPVGPNATSSPKRTPPASPKPSPIPTVFQTLVERTEMPFENTTVNDDQLDQGKTALVTAGVAGVTAITYRVTIIDGVETARETVSELIELTPVTEVTSIGTKAAAPAPMPLVQQGNSGCHSSYSGVCVPFASDVDCAGGSGNGPAYVSGPLKVIGHDEYQLDRDGDGIACD